MSGPRLLTENQLSILLNFGNAFDAYRNAIIEECAKECELQDLDEELGRNEPYSLAIKYSAEAIRALKVKA